MARLGRGQPARPVIARAPVADGPVDATVTPAVIAAVAALPQPAANVAAGPAATAAVASLTSPNLNVGAGPAATAAVAALACGYGSATKLRSVTESPAFTRWCGSANRYCFDLTDTTYASPA